MSSTPPRIAPAEAAFYAAQSTNSDPGGLAAWYEGLPADPAELARITRGLIIHRGEGGQFHHEIAEDRMHRDAETRYVDDILRIVVERRDAPPAERREPADRFVGICRDFALLHCSMLRHAGIPARIRVGFADYFGTDGFHGDHVVTEYWDAGHGWRLADSELCDPLQQDTFKPDFDPMDVPRDRFLVAGAAWRACRAGDADPLTFGLQDPPLKGLWFIAGNVRLDLAALNRTEMLQWDIWGAGSGPDEEIPAEVAELYDRAAEVTGGPDVPFDAVRRLYRDDDRLRVPKTVTSLAPFLGSRQVTLR